MRHKQKNPVEELELIAETWIRYFNAHDLDRLLGLYHDDAIHRSPKLRERQPETQGYVRGKPALREWWQDCFTRLPHLQYDLESIATNVDPQKQQVVIEYTRKEPGEPDMYIAEVFRIKQGRIAESRVYHG